jgi:diguanylate cyclase (GGDEF)-like protein/PAS domain S-box-containing protein
MYPGSLPYALSLLIVALLTTGIAFYAFGRTRGVSANTFGWLMVAITEWVAAYAVETLLPTVQAKNLADQLTYLGIAATPALWLVFSLEYTGNAKWLTDKAKWLLSAWVLAAFGTALTNDFHHLMWKSERFAPDGLPGLIFASFGPAFWVFVVVSYVFVLAGISLYVVSYARSTPVFKKQIAIMIIGSLMPLISNALYLADSSQQHGLDRTPFAFALSGIVLAYGLFRYNLLNLVPLAAPIIIKNLPDAVVVVDNLGRIVHMNPAALEWLDTDDKAIGQNAREVLKGAETIWEHWDSPDVHFSLELGAGHAERWFDVVISLIRDKQGKALGRVIVLRDTTQEQNALQAERGHARQSKLLNSITSTALESTDLYEILQALADQMGMLLGADGVYLTLWDKSRQTAIPAVAYGQLRQNFRSTRIYPDERTLTESVLKLGKPLAIDDIFNTPHMSQSIAARFASRSILALPLIAKEERLGAALIAFEHSHHFTPDEIAVADQLGPQIALAIYKAQLLDDSYHRIAQLALLDEVSKAVADSLDERQIIQRTVEAVVNRFGYAQAAMSLLVNGDEMEIAAISGTENVGFSVGYRQGLGAGIIGYTAQTRLNYFTGDIEHDPYYYTIGKRSGSAGGVPLLNEGQLLGVLYVESTEREAFGQYDIQTLQTLAGHVATAMQKARLFARTQEQLRAITALQSISQTVTSTLNLQEIFETVVQLLKDTFDYTHVSIYLLDNQTLRLGAQVGYPDEMIFHEIPVTSGVVGRAVATRRAQFISNVTQDPAFLRASNEVESEICVPLLKGDSALGVVNVEAAPGHPLTQNDLDLMIALAGTVSIAVDNARLHAEVKSLALTDSLTGLLNRRAFDETLATEVARAERYGYALALIILDIDNFKAYNDRWGHPAGDQRLKDVARLLESNIRRPDVAARYGGEEFAIILPYTSRTGARALAERLRNATLAQARDMGESDGFIPGHTMSIGVATFPEDGHAAGDLLIAADDAELAAKHLGKNRVCFAGESR